MKLRLQSFRLQNMTAAIQQLHYHFEQILYSTTSCPFDQMCQDSTPELEGERQKLFASIPTFVYLPSISLPCYLPYLSSPSPIPICLTLPYPCSPYLPYPSHFTETHLPKPSLLYLTLAYCNCAYKCSAQADRRKSQGLHPITNPPEPGCYIDSSARSEAWQSQAQDWKRQHGALMRTAGDGGDRGHGMSA